MIEDGQPSFAEEVARRIRGAAKAGRFNASSLGREVGASTSAAALYWSGERPWPLELLPKVSNALGIGLQYLLTGDNLVLDTGAGRSQISEETVAVREIDLSYGMGATYLDVPITEEVHLFPRAWLRRYTRSAPDKLFFAQGIGDSMEPTLHDSDLLLIDTDQRQLTSADRIWVITYADCGMIKRLRPIPGGGVEVWSDKKEISPFTAYDGEIEIIGRVVAVQRKL
jgi:phage repressor protein C with HTH and peptisase S24 domain